MASMTAEQMVEKVRALALDAVEYGVGVEPDDIIDIVGDDLDAEVASIEAERKKRRR